MSADLSASSFVARHGLVKYRPATVRKYPRVGACEICQHRPILKPHVLFDHCHVHGWIRGLVCIRCNGQLGFLERGETSRRAFNARLLPRLMEYRLNCPNCAREPVNTIITDALREYRAAHDSEGEQEK